MITFEPLRFSATRIPMKYRIVEKLSSYLCDTQMQLLGNFFMKKLIENLEVSFSRDTSFSIKSIRMGTRILDGYTYDRARYIIVSASVRSSVFSLLLVLINIDDDVVLTVVTGSNRLEGRCVVKSTENILLCHQQCLQTSRPMVITSNGQRQSCIQLHAFVTNF